MDKLSFDRIVTIAGSLKSANFSSLTSMPILSIRTLLSLYWLTREGRVLASLMALADAMARLSKAFLFKRVSSVTKIGTGRWRDGAGRQQLTAGCVGRLARERGKRER
jgi:hypothetical protein